MSTGDKSEIPEEHSDSEGKSKGKAKTVSEAVGPGVCLREVREQLGLNRAKVGQQLGLTESAVKDLEKNRFDRFPNSVYVRGYLKNYAKTLGESEVEIIEIYDQFCAENNLDSGKSTLDPIPEGGGSRLLLKALAAMVVVIMLSALVAFFTDFI